MTHYNPYAADYAANYAQVIETPIPTRPAGIPGWRRMLFILVSIAIIVSLLLAIKPSPAVQTTDVAVEAGQSETITSNSAPSANQGAATGVIAPVFATPVQHWAPQIVKWSEAHGLDPNLVATIMQVESCGDPNAISSAGARGLFQVMPFHFAPGEDSMAPDINAARGIAYFAERLQQTGGNIGLAFAGYNGGHRAAATTWDNWPAETQRYYVWTTGIYNDIQEGLNESPTMQRWLQSGGASLCRQAAANLGITP